MAKKSKGRPVSGVLLLNKSGGMTSNTALQKAKRLFFAAKAGHTGSLDPLATGVLPICFGEATKFSQYLLDADKSYVTNIQLGVTTTTGDAEGECLSQCNTQAVTENDIVDVAASFVGEIEQIPPMYSALKHNGQPLYKLAREGKEVERKPRRITVFGIDVLDFTLGAEATMRLSVHCSKGTYIRTLAEDIGKKLGVGAHVATLHRSKSGPFSDENAVSLEQLEQMRGDDCAETLDRLLLSTDAPVADLAKLELPAQSEFYFCQGQPVMDPQVYQLGHSGEVLRVFSDQQIFLGLGEITDDGRIAPKRLVVRN